MPASNQSTQELASLDVAVEAELAKLRREEQGKYKSALATAMANVFPPSSKESILYANRMSDRRKLGKWSCVSYENVVDIALLEREDIEAPWCARATAESEAYPLHARDIGDDRTDEGYFWDLYKLMHFPSPIRVFLAVTADGHGPELVKNLTGYIQRYRHCFHLEDVCRVYVVDNSNKAHGWLHVATALRTSAGEFEAIIDPVPRPRVNDPRS